MSWLVVIAAVLIYSYFCGLQETSDRSEKEYVSGNYARHQGTSYDSGNGIRYYENGGHSFSESGIAHFSGGGRSVQEGNVTYYFDANDQLKGRSVRTGKVITYFDRANREIGHIVDNGNGVYDHFGDTFTDL